MLLELFAQRFLDASFSKTNRTRLWAQVGIFMSATGVRGERERDVADAEVPPLREQEGLHDPVRHVRLALLRRELQHPDVGPPRPAARLLRGGSDDDVAAWLWLLIERARG